MSAEVLRRAAALMRERAEAAAPGPWRMETDYLDTATGEGGDPYITSYMGHVADVETGDDAAQIASWHPAVALAVADWLDDQLAAFLETRPGNYQSTQKALAVARAYLGEQP